MISQSAAAVDLNVDAGTFYVDTTNNRVGVGGKTDPDTPLHVVGTVTATLFAGSGASLTNIPNSALTNSSITINSTATSLGGSITLGTDDVAEGSSNLYYTNARADARIAAATTDDLSEGSSNLYYTDARVDARVSGGSLGNITTTGYIRGPSSFTIDPAAHGDNTGTVVIAGNLQVDGTTTTINSTTMTVDDKNITLASGSANAAAASGAGFTVDIGSGTLPAITYDGTNDEWDFNKPLNVTGNIAVSGTVDGVDIAARDAVLTSTTTTAGAALPKAGGTMTGGLSIRGFNGPVLKLGSSGTSDPRIDFEDQNSTNLGAGIFLDQDADTLRILRTVSGSATDGIAINASGNVGIGTTDPDTLLELRKDTASGSYGDYPTLSLRNDNAAGYSAIHFQEGSTQRARVEVGNNSGTPYMGLYTTGAASGITIKDGVVGIGETSPTMPLSVKAASNAYAINMHGRSDGYSELYGSSSDGSTRYAFLQTHSAQTKLFTLVNTPLLFGTNSTESYRIRPDGGLQFPDNNTLIATSDTAGGTAFEWGAFRRPASSDGGQLTVRQYSSGDTAANYPAYASSNGSGTWDENTGVYFPELDQVGLTANGNPTLTIEDGRKIELYENGFTSGDANRGQRVCLGGISHIANTNPGGTGSGTYLHIKTNLPKSNKCLDLNIKVFPMIVKIWTHQ